MASRASRLGVLLFNLGNIWTGHFLGQERLKMATNSTIINNYYYSNDHMYLLIIVILVIGSLVGLLGWVIYKFLTRFQIKRKLSEEKKDCIQMEVLKKETEIKDRSKGRGIEMTNEEIKQIEQEEKQKYEWAKREREFSRMQDRIYFEIEEEGEEEFEFADYYIED